jgi:thiamine pyrophosphate-dependent acetolactate synthase large subunit-like protein
MWTFSKVNFARMAEDIGAFGIRVGKPDELDRRLRRRCRPVIIDIVTDSGASAPMAGR